jgi:hypothetical protein
VKRLPPSLIEKIADFEAESTFSLRGYALEKDYFVTDVLALMRTLPHNPDFQWIFCGGTSLAKAHGIVHRMSEDLDFKLIPTVDASKRSKTQLRRQLSACADQVVKMLECAGYGPHAVTQRSMDNNAYTVLEIEYNSAYAKPHSLRPRLLLEINYTSRRCATQSCKVGFLLDKLITGNYRDPFDVECATLRDTLVEKWVAFPRRLAQQLLKPIAAQTLSATSGWDLALVRHIYDVHQIVQSDPSVAHVDHRLAETVLAVIALDAQEFATQFPGFLADPMGHIEQALRWAETSSELAEQYQAFVSDMVYSSQAQIPSYRQALAVFTNTLGAALAWTVNTG